MNPNEKLFLVTRRDLVIGLAAAQIVHASIQWAMARPRDDVIRWINKSNTVVLLQAEGEHALQQLAQHPSEIFREPDLNHQLTAVALDPSLASKKACRGLQLFAK